MKQPEWLFFDIVASVFTRIIQGELPARFVWKDEHAVAFLSINPLKPGHTLVVPRQEVDHWLDLPEALAEHLILTAQKVGHGIKDAFQPEKVGLMIAGLEVPHVHLHLVPVDEVHDLDFERQETNPDPRDLDAAADRIREALRARGYAGVPRD